MLDLLGFGVDSDNSDISAELAVPCFAASALRMEVSESIVCLQLYFEYNGSAPLVQQNPAKLDLENCYSFNVVFSSDTSTYRFTGKPVSQRQVCTTNTRDSMILAPADSLVRTRIPAIVRILKA